ncbi:sex pilus assembly protein TraV [Burkholderia gladioli]|uniref:Sex pilus assembly protein TraV n=1 Tax=Burkholderia gladioli TaxID=28095 RepID=A0A2A7SAF7_BURGA|nr:TraV family lipoprotein [Burkholderia gladioli]PEH40433.1 sex pilus assembly protein TraV [Burkholderia gladioli]
MLIHRSIDALPLQRSSRGALERWAVVARLVVVWSIGASLSGCAAMWNVGSTQYDCPGIPNGVVCKTPREVYEATNHRDALITMDEDGKQRGSESGSRNAGGDDRNGALGAHASVTLPQPIQQPLPILEPAKVMRIWVNSWIDQNGDLHYPGLLFTEITARRWAVGNIVAGVDGQVLTPVQVDDNRANTDAAPAVTDSHTIDKPDAVVQPYTDTGSRSSSSSASLGPNIPGLPVPDASASGGMGRGNSSPFSTNFSSGSGGMTNFRPTTNWNARGGIGNGGFN